ncbi:tRNA(Ile)-lysidine synthase [Modicisalibacter ilicicola DSM 19980]|uniref:tRNA(Ile)-lysidine synthase n=1 Tax=Modicisalibacter ilicicola DSM 19980 TaxID=1121942 RepID=A0A1M4V505_9GAMM|nr:tRNA lysidine(34) synthetase TilS [Halomonas ilicicola]SHE64009.1 tRNA(Ile)-lysidine synthase [Halomonas ilicicola DSM 19980]
MSLQTLIDDALATKPPDRPVWIALSGGLDSCLLLTLAVCAARRRARPLYALHVNHALQPAAADFENHCRVLCSRLGVPFYVEQVRVEPRGQGLEAAAREARYAAFLRRVRRGETLWLAQHADDQAETLLLAGLRGSGVRGLAGMPPRREWRGRHLVRPLLACTRRDLEHEASRQGVDWIEDPSNADTALDRNFLRQEVMPLLAERWPEAARSLARSARLAGEADQLLDELAALDLVAAGGEPGRLRLVSLRQLCESRQRLLIRHACQCLGLPPPPLARLQALLSQLDARGDARVAVVWSGAEARCWRGGLYLQSPEVEPPTEWQCEWDGRPGLMTPAGRIEHGLMPGDGRSGIALRLTLRRGGERMHVAGRGRRDVKRLLQEAGIPPWRRSRQLLAWQENELVAVLGVAVAPGWVQSDQVSAMA